MTRSAVRLLLLLLALLPARAAPAQEGRRQQPAAAGAWKASGSKGAVAAGGREAAEAGLSLLKDGGNAADAACATLLALTVTDSTAFCFGGEVPILVYDARRKVVEVLCGLGV